MNKLFFPGLFSPNASPLFPLMFVSIWTVAPQACSMALTMDFLFFVLVLDPLCPRELFLCLLPHFPRTHDPRFTKSCSS